MSDYENEDGESVDQRAARVAADVAAHVAHEQNTAAAQLAHKQWLFEQAAKDQRELEDRVDRVFAQVRPDVPVIDDKEWGPKIQQLAAGFLPEKATEEQAVAAIKRAAGILQADANEADRKRAEDAERARWKRVEDSGNTSYSKLR